MDKKPQDLPWSLGKRRGASQQEQGMQRAPKLCGPRRAWFEGFKFRWAGSSAVQCGTAGRGLKDLVVGSIFDSQAQELSSTRSLSFASSPPMVF